MDYEELSRLVAKDLGGNLPSEVEDELELGEPKGFRDVVIVTVTLGAFLVSLAQLSIQIAETNKTPEELVAALEAKTESIGKIAKEKRDQIIKGIVIRLTGPK
jgi:hypothetical protein